jgi:hypothetical protein
MVPRALSELQKNVTAAVSSIGLELSVLHERLAELEAASGGSRMCMADMLAEDDESGLQDSYALARLPQSPLPRSTATGAELDALAAELAAVRTAMHRAHRREFALVICVLKTSVHVAHSC